MVGGILDVTSMVIRSLRYRVNSHDLTRTASGRCCSLELKEEKQFGARKRIPSTHSLRNGSRYS